MSKKPAKHFSQNNPIQHMWQELIEHSAWLSAQQAFELLINDFVSELKTSLSSRVDLWLSKKLENLQIVDKMQIQFTPNEYTIRIFPYKPKKKRIYQDRGITIGG